MTERRADDELDEFRRRLLETHSGDEGLRDILDGLPDFVCCYLPDTTITFLNAAYARRLGGKTEDLIGRKFLDFLSTDEASRVECYLDSFSPRNPVQNFRGEIEIADGVIREFEWVAHAEYDEHGTIAGFRATGRDMTRQRQAEEGLRQSEERFRQLAENIQEVFWLTDPRDQTVIYVSPGYENLWGRSREELYKNNRAFVDAVHPEDRDRVLAAVAEHEEKGFDEEYRIVRPDGSIRWIWDRGFLVRDADGNVQRVAGIAQDITERTLSEAALRESEARFRAQFKNMPIPTYCWRQTDDDFVLIDHNDAAMTFTAGRIGDYMGVRASDFFVRQPEQVEWMREAFTGNKPITHEIDYTMQTTGEQKFLAVTMVRVPPDLLMVHTADITERRRTEQALHLTQFAVDRAADSIFWIDSEGGFRFVNDTACRNLGYSREELLSMKVMDIIAGDGAARWRETWSMIKEKGARTHESAHRTKDGRVYEVEVSANHVRFGGEEFSCSFARDITERKQQEERLRQVQKMDAVGQLTGGVAHEFNNLLAVIMGNLDFLAAELDPGSKQARHAKHALDAAERGAALTQRLLSFSRQQPLNPESVDLNALVERMAELLRPALSATIEIENNLAPDLLPVQIDAAQLEAVVLTLAVNAQDAMPDGGTLTMETSNIVIGEDAVPAETELTPGPYVWLTVRDTGHGMQPDVLARAVDPFFTTKEVGKGTGLGLSMAHGFVMQSGGHFEIESAVGRGTVLRMLLPRAHVAPAAGEREERQAAEHRGRGETILVVEDDHGVREMVVELISSLGYETVEASDGESALGILRSTPGIDLLFTDVVLPCGMSGVEVAARARRWRPDLKVLFTTGYNKSVAGGAGPGAGAEVIDKPYRKAALARKIAGALRA